MHKKKKNITHTADFREYWTALEKVMFTWCWIQARFFVCEYVMLRLMSDLDLQQENYKQSEKESIRNEREKERNSEPNKEKNAMTNYSLTSLVTIS